MSERIHVEGWEELAQVLGILKAAANETSRPSVTLEMDSKGTVKPSVKIYDDDPYKAMDVAIDIFNTVRERFGLT